MYKESFHEYDIPQLYMKIFHFSDSHVATQEKRPPKGVPVLKRYHEHGISQTTCLKGQAQYDGKNASLMERIHELEQENARLKRMYADIQLLNDALQEAITKT